MLQTSLIYLKNPSSNEQAKCERRFETINKQHGQTESFRYLEKH